MCLCLLMRCTCPNATFLTRCSYDNTIKLWSEDDDDFYCVCTLEGHKSTVWAAAFGAAGRQIVTGSQDGSLILWNAIGSNTDCSYWQPMCTFNGLHVCNVFRYVHIFSLVRCLVSRFLVLISTHFAVVLRCTFAPVGSRHYSTSVHWSRHSNKIVVAASNNSFYILLVDLPSQEQNDAIKNTSCHMSNTSPSALKLKVSFRQQCAHASDVNCARWNPCHPAMFATTGDDFLVKIWKATCSR